MSYLSYFGFDSEPFGHAPQSRFFYSSEQNTQVMRRLLHCVQCMQGLAVLIGDIGCGKTTLARRLLEALPSREYAAALVVMVHKDIGPLWLVRHIATQLGVSQPAQSTPEVLNQLVVHLMALRAQGRRAVVLVDEAQMLHSRELMEELRGMLNLEVSDAKLISFVFFGLPGFEQTLRLDPPLAQRVAMRCTLKPLDAPMAAEYVSHRLTVVGSARQTVLTDAALAAIYAYSHGVPRVINTLCDNVLLELFLAGKKVADADLVVSVGTNLNLTVQLQPPAPVPPISAAASFWAGPRPSQPSLPADGSRLTDSSELVDTVGDQRPPSLADTQGPCGVSQQPGGSKRFDASVPDTSSQLIDGLQPPPTNSEAAPDDWAGLMSVGSLLSNQASSTAKAPSGTLSAPSGELPLLPSGAVVAQNAPPQAEHHPASERPAEAWSAVATHAAPQPAPQEYSSPMRPPTRALSESELQMGAEAEAAGGHAAAAIPDAKAKDASTQAMSYYGTLNLDEVSALLAQLNNL